MNRGSPRLLAVLVAVGSMFVGSMASAQEPLGLRERVDAEIAEAEATLDEVNGRLAELDARRERLDRDLGRVRIDQIVTAVEIKKEEDAVEQLDARIRADRRRLRKLRKVLADRAIAAYVSGSPEGDERVLTPDAADDGDDIGVFLTALNESDDELAARIENETVELSKTVRKRRERRADLKTKRVFLEALDAKLEETSVELFLVALETQEEAAEAQAAVEEALHLASLIEHSAKGLSIDGRPLCDVAGFRVACEIGFEVGAMVAAAERDGVHLGGSAYRDTVRQIELRRAHCGGDVWDRPSSACTPPTARPGSSQHERGLAIDFTNCSSRTTACFGWLAEHAAEYGFKNLPSEPWHWSTTGN